MAVAGFWNYKIDSNHHSPDAEFMASAQELFLLATTRALLHSLFSLTSKVFRLDSDKNIARTRHILRRLSIS